MMTKADMLAALKTATIVPIAYEFRDEHGNYLGGVEQRNGRWVAVDPPNMRSCNSYRHELVRVFRERGLQCAIS